MTARYIEKMAKGERLDARLLGRQDAIRRNMPACRYACGAGREGRYGE